MHIKIAVVQFDIQQLASEANLGKAEHFIKEASSQQAQIIVFPEDFITGPLSGKRAFADYEKVNLWLPERSYITPGEQITVFNTVYGRVGLIICWDLMFPEVFRSMVNQDVDMVICPSYWCFEDAG